MLRSPRTRLAAITRLHVAPWVAQLVDRLLRRAVPARVQRMGNQALKRVVERFPELAELLISARGAAERSPWAPSRSPASGPQAAVGTPPVPDLERAAVLGDTSATPIPSSEREMSQVAPLDPRERFEDLLTQLTAASWQVRAQAAEALSTLESLGVEEALHRALRDDSAEVASAAALALSRHGSARAIAALREVLENRDGYFSPVTRAACVHGLARCLGTVDTNAVLDVLADVDAEVSIAAIAVVAERLPELAMPRLLAVLSDDTSYFLPMVRLAAANALTRLGTLSQDTITGLLSRERDDDVRSVLERACYEVAQA
jgi:hypothetical protein